MQPHATKEPRRQKGSESIQGHEPAIPQKHPVHSQPASPPDDLQARITNRAYELYAERGYRQGHALDDWLEAEREIRGVECNA